MSAASDILKLIKEKEIEFVDLRFTDPRGKLQHMTQDLTTIDEDFLNEGTFFDGSSIAGWKAINESDMILKPDLSRTFVDPFTSHNTLVLFCDIMDPIKKDYYERDPRSIAKKAEAYLKTTGIGDTIYFGPEPEFLYLMMLKFLTLCKKYLSKLTVTKVLTMEIKNIQTETWVIDQLLKVVISQCLQLIAVRI